MLSPERDPDRIFLKGSIRQREPREIGGEDQGFLGIPERETPSLGMREDSSPIMPVVKPAGRASREIERPRLESLPMGRGDVPVSEGDPLQPTPLRPQFQRTEGSFDLYAHGLKLT